MWGCLLCAVGLDILGEFTDLGFDPTFQLETQVPFFIVIVATVVLLVLKAKLGPLLAGVIFWIPILFLAGQVLLSGQIIPFDGDIVGIAELVVAVVGVVAAHNIYHKLENGLWGRVFPRRAASSSEEDARSEGAATG